MIELRHVPTSLKNWFNQKNFPVTKLNTLYSTSQVHIKMLRDGMLIEARHVKRKQLNQYLEGDFLKQEKRSMDSHNEFNNTLLANRKRLSTELAQSKDPQQQPANMQPNQQNVNTQQTKRRRPVSESVSSYDMLVDMLGFCKNI